jgi:hypothetical protein
MGTEMILFGETCACRHCVMKKNSLIWDAVLPQRTSLRQRMCISLRAFGHIHTALRNRMKAENTADITPAYWCLRMRGQLEEGRSHQYYE